ncbi:Cro/CI family transcriptional regulator [Escherichia coli]
MRFIAYNNRIKPEELIRHFLAVLEKAAAGVGVTPGAVLPMVNRWKIPSLRQSDIEVRTAYKLKSDFTTRRVRQSIKESRKRGS